MFLCDDLGFGILHLIGKSYYFFDQEIFQGSQLASWQMVFIPSDLLKMEEAT